MVECLALLIVLSVVAGIQYRSPNKIINTLENDFQLTTNHLSDYHVLNALMGQLFLYQRLLRTVSDVSRIAL